MKEGVFMTSVQSTPLLLLDNSNMMSVVNQGEFKCTNLSFEEAKAIIEMHEEADVLRCFDDDGIQTIIFNYLGIERREFPYKHIRNMRPGQDASHNICRDKSRTPHLICSPTVCGSNRIEH